MQTKLIEFKQTWCDYLTPCPHMQGKEVGSYQCQVECPYFKGVNNPQIDLHDSDYGKYFKVHFGYVECSFRETPTQV